MPITSFAGVVLDVDATLTRVEGIEWLAQRRGVAVLQRVAEMTERAMAGTVPLDEVYGTRLALVRPSRDDLAALAAAYIRETLAGAQQALQALREGGIELTIVSGGLRQAVLPFASSLGVDEAHVHAVSVDFAANGEYAGFDTGSPLARRGGKPALLRQLRLARPLLAVGDGSTDAELKCDHSGGAAAVDAFAAFVGVAARPAVVAVADYVVHRFDELPEIVRGGARA